MFRTMLLQFVVAGLQTALKNQAFSNLLTQLLGGLANNPGQVQQLQMPQEPPDLCVEGNTLKITHKDGQVHDVDLSAL